MDKLKVLVVEDHPLIQMDLEEALQSGGYDTVAASSGEAGIAALEANSNLRALVTDIDLGTSSSGWDVARRARKLFPDLPVVYVTSVAAEEWTAQGVPKSVLIAKPFAPAQILTAVSLLLVNTGEPPSVPPA